MLRGTRTIERPAQSVRKDPGSMAVTWMPNPATSLPTASRMPSSAYLLPQYAETPGKPARPPIEVTARMCPRRRSRLYGRTARTVAAAPNTLTSNWARSSLSGVSSKVPSTP
jgi:hypothetical protein